MTVARPTRRHKPAEFTSVAEFLKKRSDRGWADGNLHASGQLPYPWVTPVLGSGCTNSGASRREVKAIAGAIKNWVASNYTEHNSEGMAWGDLAGEFMDALIEDRASLGNGVRSHDDRPQDMSVAPWLGYLALAGAVLTRLYYGILAQSSAPPLRRHLDDDAHANSDLPYLATQSEFIASCRDIVGKLRDAVGTAPDDSPVKHIKFLAEIDENLSRKDGVAVKLAHLRSLCELAWLALANYSATTLLTYPGWTDLLAHLSAFSERPSPTGHPTFEDITTADGLLSALYRKIAIGSLEAGADNRPRIFGAIAQLLKRQAEMHVETNQTVAESPPAVAFSTSFDVELEAALTEQDQPFVLAIPVYATVTDGHGKRAYPLWIACTIGRKEDLTNLIGSGGASNPDQWKLLTNSFLAGFAEKLPPVVVRLAGCPIVNCPSLRPQHLAERAEGGVEGPPTTLEAQIVDAINANVRTLTRDDTSHKQTMAQLTLSHAVVINEHDAVLQNALDTIAQPDGHPTNGLPLRLIHDKSAWERYWLMVGVQVRDTAVRHRVAALISTVRVQGTPRPQVLQRPIGLVANTSLTDVETDLFIWSGFDVTHGPDVTADKFADVIRKSTAGLAHLRDLALAIVGRPARTAHGGSGD